MRTKLPSKRVPAPPKTQEELKELAESLHGQILETIQSAKQSKQSLFQEFSKDLGVPRESDMNRLIWHALVLYANANLRAPHGLVEGVKAFDILTILCVNRLADSLELENPLADLSPFKDLHAVPTRESYVRRVFALQNQCREMLIWLADPNSCSDELRQQAFRFLMEHGAKDALLVDMRPNDEFDETANDGYPLFYWKMPLDYRTILTPAATFILERIDKYQESELTLADAVPLMICKRPECRKFAVALRKTKDFCSNSCRTLFRQKSKKENWADYMRQYRANNY